MIPPGKANYHLQSSSTDKRIKLPAEILRGDLRVISIWQNNKKLNVLWQRDVSQRKPIPFKRAQNYVPFIEVDFYGGSISSVFWV